MKKIIVICFILNSLITFGNNPPIDIVKIMKSGNGQSIETAYKVYSVDQEYELLHYLKLKPVMQKLHIKVGDFYDAITTTTKTVYFKIIKKSGLNKKQLLSV